jgi:hypothetical protein
VETSSFTTWGPSLARGRLLSELVHESQDLLLVIGLTAATVLAVLGPLQLGLVQVLLGLPFVLLFPGYALTAAAFPDGTLRFAERLLLSVGASLSSCALIGLLLHLLPAGITLQSWIILLSSLIVIGSCVGLARRVLDPSPTPVSLEIGIGLNQGLLLALAGLISIGAVGVARLGVAEQETPGFTQFWALPAESDGQPAVRLGVTSMEPAATRFVFQLQTGDHVLHGPMFELQPGQTWETTLKLPADGTMLRPGGALEATLYRQDAPGTVYRRAAIRLDQALAPLRQRAT